MPTALPSAVRRIVLALVVSFAPISGAQAAPHILVELGSGKVLAQEDAFDRWYPASLTKLMTTYTVFREVASGRLSLKSPVLVTKSALAEAPSKMGFPVGTVINIDNALKMLMVKSANDIATAIAESVGGSEAAFVAKMNENAARLGMNDTRFANAHGLHDPAQYTSARDLAVLAIAIRKEFPKYNDYFGIQAIRVGKQRLANHNPLLSRYDGTTGMKTGFICASGLNIVVTVKRGMREIVAVVLGGPTGRERNVRAARLLTEAFGKSSLFATQKLATLKPTGAVNRQPIDLRDTVCAKRPAKKQAAKKAADDTEEGSETAAFALKQPSLEELEEKYLKPAKPVTKIVTVSLGDATGPDPYGLVAQGASLSAAAAAEAKAKPKKSSSKKSASAKPKK